MQCLLPASQQCTSGTGAGQRMASLGSVCWVRAEQEQGQRQEQGQGQGQGRTRAGQGTLTRARHEKGRTGPGLYLGPCQLAPVALALGGDTAGLICAGSQQAAAIHPPAHVHHCPIVTPHSMLGLPCTLCHPLCTQPHCSVQFPYTIALVYLVGAAPPDVTMLMLSRQCPVLMLASTALITSKRCHCIGDYQYPSWTAL